MTSTYRQQTYVRIIRTCISIDPCVICPTQSIPISMYPRKVYVTAVAVPVLAQALEMARQMHKLQGYIAE